MASPIQIARRAAGSVALLNVAYRAALMPRVASWGATKEEVRASLPGDDVLRVGADTTTMGTTIDAPPDRIWPWLVQMGWGRAGWYSHDLLDNAGRPSAERIVPEWQGFHSATTCPPIRACATASGSRSRGSTPSER